MPTANQRNPAPIVVVTPVGNKSELQTFIKVPNVLYKDDPLAVTRLYHERMQHFTANPFFEHADWQAWVAFRGRQPIGRISAQIDHLNSNRFEQKTGFFGSLEAPNDPQVFQALLSTAEDWLKNRQICKLIGPMNLNINQEVGLLVDGFDKPPSFMMGHALPYYGQNLEHLGYRKEVDMYAYNLRRDAAYPKIVESGMSRYHQRIKVRPLDIKRLNENLLIMRTIFNDAWEKNWGFVPFTEEEFLEIGRSMLMITDPSFMQIAELDGEPAAFTVVLPNVNEAIRDLGGKLLPFGWLKLLWRLKIKHPASSRMPLMGVLTKYQNRPIGAAAVFKMLDALKRELLRKKVTTVECSWVLEHNKRLRKIIEAFGGKPYKTYRVYSKSLGAGLNETAH